MFTFAVIVSVPASIGVGGAGAGMAALTASMRYWRGSKYEELEMLVGRELFDPESNRRGATPRED